MSDFNFFNIIIFSALTLVCYEFFAFIQRKLGAIWFNPIVFSIITIIIFLQSFEINFATYYKNTQIIHLLLEPAIVILGFPLYQQLKNIKKELKFIIPILCFAISVMIVITLSTSVWLLKEQNIAISLSFKSITTAIGIALTQQFHGVVSITTFAIIIAGLTGAIGGIKWLNFLGLKHPQAQGLAIGCASHALGTISISQISNKHAAYSALALILSAIITAIISPFLLPLILQAIN